MILRQIQDIISYYLRHFPSVTIIGPRQCGKSTLAKNLIKQIKGAIYLDLENPQDRNKLSDPLLFLSQYKGKLICLDEIQFMPDIYTTLRSVIDEQKKNGQFLLLGSASPALLRQTSETLAGRIVYVELKPFSLSEVASGKKNEVTKLWLRGGFPRSYLASNSELSMVWRKNFTQTFLERDLSGFGIGIAPENMRKFWMMCAHLHGQTVNFSNIGNSLGLTHTAIRNYMNIMTGTFMITRLEPFYSNLEKRVKKSSKYYISDSGILHALLNITSMDELLAHPVAGFSWEGFVLAQLASTLRGWEFYYIGTADQAEIDFVLKKGNRIMGIECKLSKSPVLTRGFYGLARDLRIRESYVVSPITESFPLAKGVTALGIEELLQKIK